MDSKELSPFEQQLKQFFPEVFELHLLSKDALNGGGGEQHLWTLIQQLIEINKNGDTGVIFINYSKGHIDNISWKKDLIAFKKNRPGF